MSLIQQHCWLAAAIPLACLLGWGSPTQAEPPLLNRTAPNLLANPRFSGVAGWTFINKDLLVAGVTYDATVTRGAGSGSIRLVGERTSIVSSLMPVKAGQTYTFSIYMMAQTVPSLAYCIAQATDDSGRWLRNTGSGFFAVSRADRWEELTYFYTAQPGETKVMLACGRHEPPYNPNPSSPIWLDDGYFGEGRSLEQPPSPKRPFDGIRVRVDELGNWGLKRRGLYEPVFPFCIYQQLGKNLSLYSAQGFNCVMFNQFGMSLVEQARKAVSRFNPYGMLTMIEIAQYVAPGAWAYNDLSGLARNLATLLQSPFAANILAFYWDNEAWSEYAVPQAVTDLIRRSDRLVGTRRIRPILMLQGNPGMLRQYNDMVDVAMSYSVPVDNFLQQRLEQQGLPWALAVISETDDPAVLRAAVYQQLALGARGIAFYRDPLSNGRGIESMPIWPAFAELRTELDALLFLLRQAAWTSWEAVASSSSVTVGTRDYRGLGHLILSSDSAAPLRLSLSLHGLSYRPAALVDFFSGSRLGFEPDGTVIVPLPARGTAVYRIEPASGAGTASLP